MMKEFNLLAVSPVDGRYSNKIAELQAYFSEFALIKYRLYVEIEYFISLCNYLDELSGFNKKDFVKLRKIYEEFTLKDALQVKQNENITNHDIKAAEYFLKTKFEENGWGEYKEFIHFGLTSQDINNTAVPLIVKDTLYNIYMPLLTNLVNNIENFARSWRNIPMLARTHGQPASPTMLGKELMVFVERLNEQMKMLSHIPLKGKFGGATGNFNAHFVAYPDSDWISFANNFLKKLGLERQQYTTQIEHYDTMAALFDNLKRINVVLIDFCRDVWTYISLEYFKQKIVNNEVGSSAMPHKVNPIDFENAEGNLGVANAIFNHLSIDLPVSRLQRDLTDSTVSRNIGVPFAHSLIAIKSIEKGLSKLELNEAKLIADLDDNWIIVSEAIQTVLRKLGYHNPYEKLKDLTRTKKKIGKDEIHQFIDTLKIDKKYQDYLKTITPFNYTGKAIDFSERE